jgi:hypothetical protein
VSEPTWMCTECFRGGMEIAELAPGYSLVLHGGQYFILGGQGHSDDEVLVFKHKPWPDPDPDCTAADDDPEPTRWIDEACLDTDEWYLHPSEGWALVEACRKAGLDDDGGALDCWLFDWAGKKIREYEKKHMQELAEAYDALYGKRNPDAAD